MSAKGQPYLRWHHSDHPYLRRLRQRLEHLAGGACAYCGATASAEVRLEFHHPLGRDWQPRKLSWSQRLHRYRKELLAGLVVLACEECNNKERRHHGYRADSRLYEYDTTNQPF